MDVPVVKYAIYNLELPVRSYKYCHHSHQILNLDSMEIMFQSYLQAEQ